MGFKTRVAAATMALGMSFSLGVASQPAEAATWRLYSKNNCQEILTDGTFYKLRNVCRNYNATSARVFTIYENGTYVWCVGHRQEVWLGVRSEWRSVGNSMRSCVLRSTPWVITGY